LWESSFNAGDSIIAAQVLSKGELVYLGLRNAGKLVLIKTAADNKPVYEKELVFPGIPVKVNALIRGGMNQLIALITFEQHQSINWINASNGEITASSRLPFGMLASGIYTDRSNNLLVVCCNGEIIVIKNNGLTF
jgi:hypothetical protein